MFVQLRKLAPPDKSPARTQFPAFDAVEPAVTRVLLQRGGSGDDVSPVQLCPPTLETVNRNHLRDVMRLRKAIASQREAPSPSVADAAPEEAAKHGESLLRLLSVCSTATHYTHIVAKLRQLDPTSVDSR